MTLSALIKKGRLTGTVTATVATPVTQEADPPVTVAVAKQPEPLPELSPEEESNIWVWLAHIEKADPAIIAEVLDKCRTNLEARRYFAETVGGRTRINQSQPLSPLWRLHPLRAHRPSPRWPLRQRLAGSHRRIVRIDDIVNAFYQGQGNPTAIIHDRQGTKYEGNFPSRGGL